LSRTALVRQYIEQRVLAAPWWQRTAAIRSALFLLLGSAWDAATLTRIDRWSDQLLLAIYQLLLAVLVVLQLRQAYGRRVPGWVARSPELLHLASQFLFGGLLSAFTVYYVRGAASPRALLCVVLLVGLLVLNEYAERPLRVLWVRLSLLAFCQFNGLLFALPLLSGQLLPASLVAVLALGSTAAVWLAIGAPGRVVQGLLPPAGTLAVVLLLVWLQVLPPLPLSLHRVGIFHHVERTDAGYALTWEARPLVGSLLWRHDGVFHRRPGDAAWCFSSVFAPSGLALEVIHRWERYGPDGWVEVDAVHLEVAGGRTEGFRTFSRKQNLEPGWWRVRITLPSGRELGRVPFLLVDGELQRPLITERF
jgi:hypothetical protein